MSSIALFDTARQATPRPTVRRGRPSTRVRVRRVRPVAHCPPTPHEAYETRLAPAPPPRHLAPPRTEVRLTRRGRAVVAATALGLAMATVVVAATSGGEVAAPIATTTVTVEPGQSLWEIARAAAPATDPRTTIAAIVERNALPSAGAIRPGQRLVVPHG